LKSLTFCTQVKSILQKCKGQTTTQYRSRYINSCEMDDHNFLNDDKKKLLGNNDANTMAMGIARAGNGFQEMIKMV